LALSSELLRLTSNNSNRARFGPYEADLHTHELWKYGTRLKLVGQPFEILSMLLHRSGELVTRDEMRSRLWPSDTFVDFNHGLNAAVNKLRDALSDSADSPRYIETLPRRGYRFIGEIEWLPDKTWFAAAAPAAVSDIGQANPTAVVGSDEAPMKLPDVRHSRRPYLFAAVAALLVLIADGAVFLMRREPMLSAQAMVQRTRPLLSVSNTSGPTFSPDGNTVAFYHEGEAGAGIFTSRVGSDQLQQLTKNETDCCPVWSPDGRWIAFARYENNERSIYVVSADGSEQKHAAELVAASNGGSTGKKAAATERRLDTGNVIPRRAEIDWSPDGRFIAFSGTSGIYLISPDNPSVHRVVETPAGADDWGPQFSADGQKLMYVRNHQVGEPDEIWVLALTGGDAKRLLSERGRITSPPQWSLDGRSVIYSSNRSGHPMLLRASLDAPDTTAAITEPEIPAWHPAISHHGYRLAYERMFRSLSIWQLSVTDAPDKKPELLVSSTSDTDQGPAPQFSPDGKKLAYMSDRNGTMEIWVANRDGSNPYQLTAVGGAGTPRWSPDSQSIAFDVGSTTGAKIVTVSLRGGTPQVLAQGVCPSWSRDGKWVYFALAAGSGWQVSKIPSSGGTPVQVTRNGGHAALESPDGKYLYYAKNAYAEPEIWRVPVDGGEEVAIPLIRPGTWASWQVVDGGILFVGPSLGHRAVLSFYDVARNRTSTIAVLDRTPFWLGATPDGKTVAFDQPGQEQAQAMLVENFR
jgi:Tol biopolymer transport system component/DNA-binding winged helix-turn-helix (wHTH) protein